MFLPKNLDAKGEKGFFVPLENNPEVMSHLAHELGVRSELGFYDVYSIDDPDLLACIPRPAYALLAIVPAKIYWKARNKESKTSNYEGSGANEPVIWFKQTIRHACGLIGLLHSVSNGGAKHYIETESTLDKLLKEAIPLKPAERASLLYNSEALVAAHRSAAQIGDTEAPPAEDENNQHFISFVKAEDGHLWELEGGWNGPLDRGELRPDEDVLSEEALRLGIGAFLKEAQDEGDLMFSLVALAPKN
ncbi:ubiquitinyl hydrolase 1 [Xylographa opegraphella]|nr:ubiquitinyl hydrolase 1 [Xylographa opegraphella]